MKKKVKRTITGTHFVEQRPNRELTIAAPTNLIPENRKPIARMAWGRDAGVRREASAQRVAQAFRDGAHTDAVFFLDTCFLRAPLDDAIWDALLTKQMAIPSMVNKELEDWLQSPGHNQTFAEKLQNRLERGNDRIIRTFTADDYQRLGADYYFSLLMLRKLKGKQWGMEFERAHSRPPTKEEFFAGFKKADKTFGDRAARIAWKGYCDYERENYAADEQTVLMAVLHALMTGRETTVLTRDHDLMEQFYKLVFLIDTHYRAMLFAAEFTQHPERYKPQPKTSICEGHPDFFDDRFIGDNDVFIRPNLPPHTSWNSLLPTEFDSVNVSCIWFGDGPDQLQVAEMTFCADKSMVDILLTKAKTDGLNTDRLSGSNCHIWPSPELQSHLGPCVAIAQDKMLHYHHKPYRILDMIHAMRSNEGFDLVNTISE